MSGLTGGEMAAAIDAGVRAGLAAAPENAGWESGLSSVIASYASPLPYHLLSSEPCTPDVQTFPTALALVEHLRRIYGKAAMSSSERRRPDGELEAEAARLLEHHALAADEGEKEWRLKRDYDPESDSSSESDTESWGGEVAALQGERILLEPSAADSSSSSSTAASAPALLSTLLPLQEPFLAFFQSDLHSKYWRRSPYEVREAYSGRELRNFLRKKLQYEYKLDEREQEERPRPQLQQPDKLVEALLYWDGAEDQCKGSEEYLSAVFHRVRRVYWRE